jgi:DNA-binding Lrp family transcriptional regulator
MIARAHVLINVTAGKSKQIKETIAMIDGVQNIDTVAGPYDIIATIEAQDYNKLAKIVMDEIQSIDGVMRTITCNVLTV